MQKWLLRECTRLEQCILIVAGLLLIYPEPWSDWVGVGGVVAVLAWQWLPRRAVAR